VQDRPILVVDDDPTIREAVTGLLAGEGYPVVTASNDADALRVVAQVQPRCLVLDLQMPVLDGWGVAHELKARGLALPIIVMAAARQAQGWAEQIGAAGYVAKPFDLRALLDTVAHVCPSSRMGS
jgi:CheY-like chemotaxis protein